MESQTQQGGPNGETPQTNTWTIKKQPRGFPSPPKLNTPKNLSFATFVPPKKKCEKSVASFLAPSEFEIPHLCDKNDG